MVALQVFPNRLKVPFLLVKYTRAPSLAVQRLRLHASTAEGVGPIPGWELRSHRTHDNPKGRKKGEHRLVYSIVKQLLMCPPKVKTT